MSDSIFLGKIDEEKDKDNNEIQPIEYSHLGFTDPKVHASNFTRITTLIMVFILLSSIIASVISYTIRGSFHNYTMLSFEFNDRYTPFQTYHICFFLCLFILSLILIAFSVSLFREEDEMFNKIFYEDQSYMMPFSLILMSGPFIIGTLYIKTYYTISIILLMVICSTIPTAMMYRRIKHRKNIGTTALINQNIFLSELLHFQCYIILFNLCDMITRTEDNLNKSTELKSNLAVCVNIVYLCMALALLTTYKDIVFSLMLLIIETGYLTNAFLLTFRETITAIAIILFILISLVVSILKYKKTVLGDDEEMIIVDTRKSIIGYKNSYNS